MCGWTFVTGPLAFGIAASVRVGTELGAGRPRAARVAAAVSMLFGVGYGFIYFRMYLCYLSGYITPFSFQK